MTGRVRLPADVELEDRLAFGLTARQLSLLGLTALVAYGVYTLAAPHLPLQVAVAATGPIVVVGVVLALGRRDGLPADRLAVLAARFLARPRRQLLAPEPLPAPLPGLPRHRRVAPLDLPVRAVVRRGLVELNDGSFSMVLRASSASFALRSDEEQAALVEAFGRFLNATQEPLQIAVRSEPVDLHTRANQVAEAATRLVEPALRRAAHGHARYLRELGAGGELRRREILLVLVTRARERAGAQTALERRAGEAIELLRAAGIELRLLRGDQAASLLARSLDPPGPPAGSSLEGVVHTC